MAPIDLDIETCQLTIRHVHFWCILYYHISRKIETTDYPKNYDGRTNEITLNAQELSAYPIKLVRFRTNLREILPYHLIGHHNHDSAR